MDFTRIVIDCKWFNKKFLCFFSDLLKSYVIYQVMRMLTQRKAFLE